MKKITKILSIGIIAVSLLSCNSKSAEQYFAAGKDSLNVGNYVSAIESFKKVVKMQPQQDKAFYYLGLAYSQSEINTDDAIAAFKTAISINPNYIEAYDKLIDIYANAHKISEMVDVLTRAVRANPNWIEGIQALVGVYVETNKTPEAINLLSEAVNANPTWTEGFFRFGSLQYSSGNYEEALIAFKNVYAKNSKYKGLENAMTNTYNQIIKPYKDAQDYDTCIAYCEDAIKYGLNYWLEKVQYQNALHYRLRY